jgi:hypothetical protein
MELLPEWKQLLDKAWSFRLGILASIFSAAEVALPYLAPSLSESIPPKTMAAIAAATALAGAISRLIAQPVSLPK